MKLLCAPGRTFQIWKYEVGHSMLLLMSPKGDGQPTRISVLLKPVRVIYLPALFHCEEIRIRDALVDGQFSRIEFVGRQIHREGGQDIRDHSGDDEPSWHVEAGVIDISEDELEFHDPVSSWERLNPTPR